MLLAIFYKNFWDAKRENSWPEAGENVSELVWGMQHICDVTRSAPAARDIQRLSVAEKWILTEGEHSIMERNFAGPGGLGYAGESDYETRLRMLSGITPNYLTRPLTITPQQ